MKQGRNVSMYQVKNNSTENPQNFKYSTLPLKLEHIGHMYKLALYISWHYDMYRLFMS